MTSGQLELNGRVYLITGASGGLGRELAIEFARRGATVILHGRNQEKLNRLYDEITSAEWPEPMLFPLDFVTASANDFSNAASALLHQMQTLDGIVHAAALLGSLGPIEHQNLGQWLEVHRVNLAAPFALTRAMLPMLRRSVDGSVIFTLDQHGQVPKAYWGAYAVSKAGLGALVELLADEWETIANLRVNGVVPGPMRSPLRVQTHPGEDAAALPTPKDLVPLYLHLLSKQRKVDSGKIIDAATWLSSQE